MTKRMHDRCGTILPLALIMTLMILLAGIGVGTVVIEGVQRAKNTDQGVAAYYMSDAGIERQLYAVRKQDAAISSLAKLTSSYPDGGSWKSTGDVERAASTQTFATIMTSAFAVLDLFDPDNLSAPPNVQKISVTWGNGPDCAPLAVSAGIEIGYASLKSGITGIVETDFKLARAASAPLDISTLDPSLPYRVRLRATACSASGVTVTLFDKEGKPTAFFGNLILGSEGTFGKATQKIVVTMPKQDILSGLFGGYVLFSECQLLKGGAGIPSCPP